MGNFNVQEEKKEETSRLSSNRHAQSDKHTKHSNDIIDNYKDDTMDSVLNEMNKFINKKCNEHNKKSYPVNYYKIYRNTSIRKQLITYKNRLQNVWNGKLQNESLIYYLIDGSTASLHKNISFKGTGGSDIYYFFTLNCGNMQIKNIFIQQQYPDFMIDIIIDYLPAKICFAVLYFYETHGRGWDKRDRECDDFHTETLIFKIIKLDSSDNSSAFELKNRKCINSFNCQQFEVGNPNDFNFRRFKCYGGWTEKQHLKLNSKIAEIMTGAHWASKKALYPKEFEDCRHSMKILKQKTNDFSKYYWKIYGNAISDSVNIETGISDSFWANIVFDKHGVDNLKYLYKMVEINNQELIEMLQRNVINVLNEKEKTYLNNGGCLSFEDNAIISNHRKQIEAILAKLEYRKYCQWIECTQNELNNLFSKTREELNDELPEIDIDTMQKIEAIKSDLNNLQQIKEEIFSYSNEFGANKLFSLSFAEICGEYSYDAQRMQILIDSLDEKFTNDTKKYISSYDELFELTLNKSYTLKLCNRWKKVAYLESVYKKYLEFKDTLDNIVRNKDSIKYEIHSFKIGIERYWEMKAKQHKTVINVVANDKDKKSYNGDWNCPQCNFMNFASRRKCKKCSFKKGGNDNSKNRQRRGQKRKNINVDNGFAFYGSLTQSTQNISILLETVQYGTKLALNNVDCKYFTIGNIASDAEKNIIKYIKQNKKSKGIKNWRAYGVEMRDIKRCLDAMVKGHK